MAITTNLLQALLSPDGNIRNQAETVFNSLSLADRVQGLLGAITAGGNNNNDANCQLIAAVLLRRDILKLTDTNMLQQLVTPLLQVFLDRQFSSRKQVGHCLAEICACLSALGDVQPVLKTILSTLGSSFDDVVSLKLLAQLADRAPIAFSQLAVPSLPTIMQQQANSAAANLDAWTEVVVNAAIATTVTKIELVRTPVTDLDSLVVDPNSPAAMLGTSCLQTYILPGFGQCNDASKILSALQSLSEAAVTCPSLLAATPALLESATNVCLAMAKQSTMEDITLAALEVLSSLLSVGDVRRRVLPPTVASAVATAAIPICAQLLVEGVDEDIQDWVAEPATLVNDGMDEENEEQFLFAESLMELFLKHLGAPALSVALPLVQQLFSNTSDWRYCHAGLATLECALAGTPVSVRPYINDIVKFATSFASNNNVRVQYRAVRLLGVLCGVQDLLALDAKKVILENVAGALSHHCTKISATASLSLVSFIRGGGEMDEEVGSMLLQYLPDVMTALVQGPLSLLGSDNGSATARVRAMGATACVAQAAGENFGPYYAIIMPGLLATAQESVVELAGAAVEAATIVGRSVGKDMFHSDALQLLKWILPTLQSNPLEQLLLACARIASVLEDEFAPYANGVVPILLHQAQQPPDVSILEGADPSSAQPQGGDMGEGSMTVPVPGRGLMKVTINTSQIQEKAQAARAVYELAKSMGAGFGPWAQQSLDTFLPLVSFAYSADVRSTAAQTLSAIFDSTCKIGEQTGNMELAQRSLPILADAISKQIAVEMPNDMDSLYALSDSLSEVFYIAYTYRDDNPGIMAKYSISNAEATVDACLSTFKACLERRHNLTSVLTGQHTGEDEKDEYNRQLSEEDNLLTPLVDSMGYNLKFFCQQFMPLYEQKIVPLIGPGLTNLSDVCYSRSAMLLFDDCLEHCGPNAAAKYAPQLLQGILLAFSSGNEDLFQAAVYGVNQIARQAPNTISMDNCLEIVQKLMKLSSRNKEDENAYLIELSGSALASLALFGRFSDLKCVPRETLIQSFIRVLPIQQDNDEGKICHAEFCTLVESGAVDLSANAGCIANIVGTILTDVEEGDEVATPDTCERLKSILFQMQQNLPASTMQQSFGALNGNVQQVVVDTLQELALSRSNVITP